MGNRSDQDDDQRELQEYARKLQFQMHQLAMRSTERTEAEFEGDLSTLGVLPESPEFDEAKRAWRRFQRKDAHSTF
jgi:hypothetical protein